MGVDVTQTPTVEEEPAAAASGLRAGFGEVDRHQYAVALLAALAAAVYALYAYLRFRQGTYFGWDLGIFDQTVRAYAHLHLPYITTLRHDTPADRGQLEWTDHFSPILVVLAPMYWLSNSSFNLLFAQAVLFAAAAVPIFAFARRRLGMLTTYLATAVYLLYWPLQSALAFDFHEAAFAPLLIALLVERADARRWRQAGVVAALLLLVKEDMGLVVAMLGVWIMIRAGRRERCDRRQRLIGACFTVAGLAALVLIVEVVMPLAGASPMRDWQYGSLGATPGKAAVNLFEHPSLIVTRLIDPHAKVTTVLWLLLPVLFLCLRSWLLLLAVPLVLERYFADIPFYWIRADHYNSFLAAIIVVAAVDGVSRFRRPRLHQAWAVAALAVSVALLPRFPLWTLTERQIWATSASLQAQERLLGRLPVGADVLVPWPTDPYTRGHVHPINTGYTKVAPEWMLTADLGADVASLNQALPRGTAGARYVPYAIYGGWTLARLAGG